MVINHCLKTFVRIFLNLHEYSGHKTGTYCNIILIKYMVLNKTSIIIIVTINRINSEIYFINLGNFTDNMIIIITIDKK